VWVYAKKQKKGGVQKNRKGGRNEKRSARA
jgi:hypothetical protein